MAYPRELRTRRLSLSPLAAGDGEQLAAINADPDVYRFLGPLDHAGSLAQAARFAAHWDEHGFGVWALRVHGDDALLGFAGLSIPFHFPEVLPAVENGWRLRRDAWGRGYATEAAHAAMAHGFAELGLDEIISLIRAGNTGSLAVARRLGMTERERRGDVVVLSVTPTSAGAARRAPSPPAGRR